MLWLDGWYVHYENALAVASTFLNDGVGAILIVRSTGGLTGVVYGAERPVYPAHTLYDRSRTLLDATIKNVLREGVTV